jgi:ADP-dependent phosphofructokinase/glucokinase
MHQLVDWKAEYVAALSAATAPRKREARIACGFTNNVDVLLKLDDDIRRTLEAIAPPGPLGPLPSRIQSPADVLQALWHHMPTGTGDVMAIESAEMSQWMEDHFHGPLQLGGTGAQAANTLAHLGYPSLLHITRLSRIDASMFANGTDAGRIAIATPEGLRPLPEAVRATDRPTYHYVFEYQTGDKLQVGACDVTATRANRVIMGYDPINAVLPLDPLFMKAVADPNSRVDRVLISGYTDLKDIGVARARIGETVDYLRDLRRQRPELLFHLELASVTEAAVMRPILDEMAPHADSLGLNEQELALAAEAWGWPQPVTVEERLEILNRMRDRLGLGTLRRIGMHTQDYCLTLTGGNPLAERHGLLFASLVAGTRARLGRFPTLADLHQTLADSAPSSCGLEAERRLAERLNLRDGLGQYEGAPVVWVPTLGVSHPAGTVGLGDSFTAGVLVFLNDNRPLQN